MRIKEYTLEKNGVFYRCDSQREACELMKTSPTHFRTLRDNNYRVNGYWVVDFGEVKYEYSTESGIYSTNAGRCVLAYCVAKKFYIRFRSYKECEGLLGITNAALRYAVDTGKNAGGWTFTVNDFSKKAVKWKEEYAQLYVNLPQDIIYIRRKRKRK